MKRIAIAGLSGVAVVLVVAVFVLGPGRSGDSRRTADAGLDGGARTARTVTSQGRMGTPDGLRRGQAGVPAAADGVAVVDSSRLAHDAELNKRFLRHKSVVQLLNSPARATPECRAIATLCQEYGYGAWAVGGAYEIAYEHAIHQKEFRVHPDTEPEVQAVVEIAANDLFEQRIRRIEDRLAVRFDPGFIERVKQVDATVFFGQLPLSIPDGAPLLDELAWEQALEPAVGQLASQPGLEGPRE